MPELNSEAIDFRAASECFAPIRKLTQHELHSLQLTTKHLNFAKIGERILTTEDGSHAQWQFTGAYAANALGLSDQVPAKVIILTDGVPRRVALGKLVLVFRRAAPRNLLGAGQRAGLVIQALRYLHGSPDMPKHISKLKKDLDARTKKDLAALTPKLAAWMRPLAQQITQP